MVNLKIAVSMVLLSASYVLAQPAVIPPDVFKQELQAYLSWTGKCPSGPKTENVKAQFVQSDETFMFMASYLSTGEADGLTFNNYGVAKAFYGSTTFKRIDSQRVQLNSSMICPGYAVELTPKI